MKITPGRPVWVTITSRDSGVSLSKRYLFAKETSFVFFRPVVDICAKDIGNGVAPWSPRCVFHGELGGSLPKKDIYSDFSFLPIEMCDYDYLSPGKWRRSRAAQLLDQLVQVGLELDPPAKCKLAELD